MLRVVDAVGELFRERYAPAELKAATRGWSLDAELARLKSNVDVSPELSVPRFQSELRRFFRSPHDIHTSLRTASGRAVWLGLHLRRVEGRMRVAWIDRTVLPDPVFPFAVGDEVVSFDGQPIDVAVNIARVATQWVSTAAFEQSFAEWFLTFRATDEWPEIPEPGSAVRLELRDASKALRAVSLTWLDSDRQPPSMRCPFWGKTRSSYLPALGAISWDSGPTTVFVARIYEASGRRYGYLRLHTYDLPADAQLRAVDEVRQALARFGREHVVALLLDQTGNGGGNYHFGLALLRGLLVDPVRAPAQRFLMTKEGGVVGWGDRANIEELVSSLGKLEARHPIFAGKEAFLPPTRENARALERYFRFFLEQPIGTRLTAPHAQIGESVVPLEPPLYAGPVVLAIDELNLSAAELVAAALRDGGRVRLFGTTTAGAGGDQRSLVTEHVCANGERDDSRPLINCVEPALAADLKALGIAALSYTVSLGMRADGTYLENQGVAPDVSYALTAEDLRTGFMPLRAKLIETLDDPPRLR